MMPDLVPVDHDPFAGTSQGTPVEGDPFSNKPEDLSWRDVPGKALQNVIPSAGNFIANTVQPFLHPSETIENIGRTGVGALQKLGIPTGGEDRTAYADAVGKFLMDRYGSIEGLKQTLATDPVGVIADASMVLTGGGTAAERLPGKIGEIGKAASTIGRTVDPLNIPPKIAQAGTALTKTAAGRYMTHTGNRPFTEAYQAGKEGGEGAEAFQSHLRNKAPQEESVEEARKAVDAIGREAGEAYRSGMIDIGKDKSMLEFTDIYDAIDKHKDIGKYKGVDLETPQVADIRERMRQVVDEWRGYAPIPYHTPEGMDALKRKLGNIYAETERGSPARVVAQSIYNSVVKTIEKQTPAYSKVMEGYSKSKEIIKELESELSLKRTGQYDNMRITTALRKLESTMRNNVATAYGSREKMVQMLVDNGAGNLLRYLAGDALSSWTARGFGALVGSAGFMHGIYQAIMSNPMALAQAFMTIPLMSPRLLGEVAYYAGKTAGAVEPYAGAAKPVARGAFQIGRIPEPAQ